MRILTVAMVSVFAFLCFVPTMAGAAEKGKNKKKDDKKPDKANNTIEFIMDHSTELKITVEQTQKLDALATAETAIMADPTISAMFEKLRATRKSGTPQALAEQRQRISEKIKEKTGGRFGMLNEEINKILTPDQQATLTALRKKDEPATKSDPKAGDGPLNPFEL